jgi:hypothetical protein
MVLTGELNNLGESIDSPLPFDHGFGHGEEASVRPGLR